MNTQQLQHIYTSTSYASVDSVDFTAMQNVVIGDMPKEDEVSLWTESMTVRM